MSKQSEQKSGLAILIDFEKAFDYVSLEFIQTSLEIFGFGIFFRKWKNILLGNFETKIIDPENNTETKIKKRFVGVYVVNGYQTDQFKILRGCKQGDPITGYLFVLCIEILALTIKNSKVSPYETIKENKNLNDTYADDLTLFLKLFPHDHQTTKTNIKYALECISKFSSWSGLNINKTKNSPSPLM